MKLAINSKKENESPLNKEVLDELRMLRKTAAGDDEKTSEKKEGGKYTEGD